MNNIYYWCDIGIWNNFFYSLLYLSCKFDLSFVQMDLIWFCDQINLALF